MEKIENCPFCGGMAVLKRIPDATYFPYYVRCSNVNCEMNVATCSRKTPEEAIKIWNHRPGEADAQPGWIPCDVRTPKHVEESYWICTDTGYQCQCRWTNNVFGLGARDEWGWKLLDIPQYSKVVAWQPLPTPYREGKQDEQN